VAVALLRLPPLPATVPPVDGGYGGGGGQQGQVVAWWGAAGGHGQVRALHARAGGGAGAGLQRVPQAQLAAQAAAHQGVSHTQQHRAQADQGLVPEPQVRRTRLPKSPIAFISTCKTIALRLPSFSYLYCPKIRAEKSHAINYVRCCLPAPTATSSRRHCGAESSKGAALDVVAEWWRKVAAGFVGKGRTAGKVVHGVPSCHP
jgi:hypothetical protein